jgi:lysozyme
MKTSDKGIAFIAQWEGFSPTAYMDDHDGWTIGYGHLIKPSENHLINATLTKEQALALKKQDVGIAEAAIRGQVSAPLNQNQFDALVSLIYNIGSGQFSGSTVKRRINSYDTKENITEAWQRWNKDDGKVVQGLINRRKAETDLFNSVDEKKNSLPQV